MSSAVHRGGAFAQTGNEATLAVYVREDRGSFGHTSRVSFSLRSEGVVILPSGPSGVTISREDPAFQYFVDLLEKLRADPQIRE